MSDKQAALEAWTELFKDMQEGEIPYLRVANFMIKHHETIKKALTEDAVDIEALKESMKYELNCISSSLRECTVNETIDYLASKGMIKNK